MLSFLLLRQSKESTTLCVWTVGCSMVLVGTGSGRQWRAVTVELAEFAGRG